MRLAPLVLVVLTAAAHAAPCEVTFVVVPDDARQTIERWVEAEARCAGPIEVRVVPTDGGLFVLGQRPDGRIHERLVPDAETAGVLVASWVADAWTSEPSPSPSPSPSPAPSPGAGAEALTVTRPVVVTPRPRDRGRWVSGALLVGSVQLGGRGEVDLFASGDIRLGVAAMAAAHQSPTDGGGVYGTMWIDDYRVGAYAAWALTHGAWFVRPSLGVGVVHSQASIEATQPGNWTPIRGADTVTSLDYQGQMIVGREVRSGWSLAAGFLATRHRQSFIPDDMSILVDRNTIDLHAVIAISHGL